MRISPPPRSASDRASEDANVRLLFQSATEQLTR